MPGIGPRPGLEDVNAVVVVPAQRQMRPAPPGRIGREQRIIEREENGRRGCAPLDRERPAWKRPSVFTDGQEQTVVEPHDHVQGTVAVQVGDERRALPADRVGTEPLGRAHGPS
jgi:hypothetical protein